MNGHEITATATRTAATRSRLRTVAADPRGAPTASGKSLLPVPKGGFRDTRNYVTDVFSRMVIGWSMASHRKTLGWKTPAEALEEHLRCAHQTGVATTR